ncbi:MAG TPA: hypothetical protein VLT45_11455, partial [Kofleriaceae bacterium]|nr:hypothetical protein [Kofleriaceae bacterium]
LRNRYPAAVAATTASPELEIPVPEVPVVAQPLVERAPTAVSKPFLVPKESPKIEAPKPTPEPAISVDPQSSARAVAMAKIEARAVEKAAVEPVKSVVVPPVPPVTKTDKVFAKTAAVNRPEPPKPDLKPERKSPISDAKEQILTAADDIGPSVVVQKVAEPPLFSSYTNASAALEREHGEERGTRMLILAVVAVVIAAIAGGAWWYKNHSTAPEAPAPVEQQVAQDAAPPTPVPEVSTPASNQPAVVLSPKCRVVWASSRLPVARARRRRG